MKPQNSSEFEAFRTRAVEAATIATTGLAGGDTAALDESYRSAVRFVLGILSLLMLEPKDVLGADKACRMMRDDTEWRNVSRTIAVIAKSTGVDILKSTIDDHSAQAAVKALLNPDQGSLVHFDIPSGWISLLYEHFLNIKPKSDSNGVTLDLDSINRKRSGSFYTPPYVIDYIVRHSLGKLDDSAMPRILDPSMGAGNFLIRALSTLSHGCNNSVTIAENCLFGCDIDPIAVDITRFLIWFETGCKADARVIARHVIRADALASELSFRWQDAFPDAFLLFPDGPGFHAVIGNPPYVAAKNGAGSVMGNRTWVMGKEALRQSFPCPMPPVPILPKVGQTDYYLLFLESMIENQLVRVGGMLGMVLPDPFLVRENAAQVREKILRDWTVESIVHIAGVFREAQVANVILICSNEKPGNVEFPVVRLDKAEQRRRFELNPERAVSELSSHLSPKFALAQPRAEALYLADNALFKRLHGPDMSLSKVVLPFVFLEDIGVEAVFRGEEIGKRTILESEGDLPILLGGQSVHRYRVDWEGNHIAREAVSKQVEWYMGEKILLQKSSARLIAAFDPDGLIVPQSVYGIKLKEGAYSPLYLLALLNSRFLNDYVFQAFTGYKLVQPQIELEDVRRLPIRTISFTLDTSERASLADEGQRIFRQELSGSGDFLHLGALVRDWLTSGKEDAVHDILVHLAGLAISARKEDPLVEIIVERIDRALDAVVERLYS